MTTVNFIIYFFFFFLTILDGYVRSGLKKNGYKILDYNPPVQFTYNFNVFVMMTFFNFINARKLDDQVNVVKGIFSSPFFIPILAIILFLQALILTFTGVAFRVAPWVKFT